MAQPAIYAQVILDIQAPTLKNRVFTYSIPAHLKPSISIGSQVLVPFGQSHSVSGFVLTVADSLPASLPVDITVKDILAVLENELLFSTHYVHFLQNVASYYSASLAEVMTAAIPASLVPRLKRRLKLKTGYERSLDQLPDQGCQKLVQILSTAANQSLSLSKIKQIWQREAPLSEFYRTLSKLQSLGLIETTQRTKDSPRHKTIKMVVWKGEEPQPTRQKVIVNVLNRHGGQLALPTLLKEAGTTLKTIQRMAEQSIIEIASLEQIRNPLEHMGKKIASLESEAFVLSAEQKLALATLFQSLDNSWQNSRLSSKEHQPWLLHGVTGSGKTEIYLRLIEYVLQQGRSALFLVPEISLTSQIAKQLLGRFGEKTAIWHSAISEGERYDTWCRLRDGQARVLLGARSAIFVDIPDLGLIILDEEHDSSYKQTSPSPRYNAKEVALIKARECNSMVLLGSATPNITSYYQAHRHGCILNLSQRIFNRSFPDIAVVDMRIEFANNNRSIFSERLVDALVACIAREEQAILLMNRRGFASHVFCRACGYVIICDNCSVPLVFHQNTNHMSQPPNSGQVHPSSGHLACHHCGFQCAHQTECPSCHSNFFKHYGLGTQRVEHELRKLMPQARVLRLDSDITARKGAHMEVLDKFVNGEADILIGTQMVAKGLDIARVTLVGVLSADAVFNLPDYRTIERGFQLLTQVSGRSGRGNTRGSVIIQTYNPDQPALIWAKEQDYGQFYESELRAREAFDYPPFSQLIRVVVASSEQEIAEQACEKLAEELSQYLESLVPEAAIKILGPAPCLLEKLRNKYRMHLLIKNKAGENGHKLLTDFLKNRIPTEGITVAVDVDAIDLF